MARRTRFSRRVATKKRLKGAAPAFVAPQDVTSQIAEPFANARSRYPVGFYVYELIDPANGLPFYAGKGQGNRAWQHEAYVRSGKPSGNARKEERIRQIIRSGFTVEIRIVAAYGLESDALEHEWRLVDASPTLTNIAPGGIGRAETPLQMARRAWLRAQKLTKLREQEKEQSRQRDIDRKASNFAAAGRTEAHAQQIDVWAADLKANGTHLSFKVNISGSASRKALDDHRASKA